MKRIAILMTVLLVIAPLALWAGGGGEGAADPNTLSFTAYQPHFGSSANGTVVMQEWLKMMENHLGMEIDIRWEEYHYRDYIPKLEAYIASGDFFDVWQAWPVSTSTVSPGEAMIRLI